MVSCWARRLVFDKFPPASILVAAPMTLHALARRQCIVVKG